MIKKLNAGEKHMLKLIRDGGRDHEGWAEVSGTIARAFFKPGERQMPPELYIFVPSEAGGGRVRLTPLGFQILQAMEWI